MPVSWPELSGERREIRAVAGSCPPAADGSAIRLGVYSRGDAERLPMTLHDLHLQLTPRKLTSRRTRRRVARGHRGCPNGEGARAFHAGAPGARRSPRRIASTANASAAHRCRRSPAFRFLSRTISTKPAGSTLAGSTVLEDAPPAARDATAVARLRAAGAVIIGRTNMTEFAYSGLGINPHYGTPRNVYDRAAARIPGRLVVGRGDFRYSTAWPPRPSARIPAARRAFPRRSMVSSASSRRRGACRSMACCRSRSRWIRRVPSPATSRTARCSTRCCRRRPSPNYPSVALRGTRLAVPQTVVLDELSPAGGGRVFRALHETLGGRRRIVELPLREFARAAEVNPRGAISSAEAYWWHRAWIRKAPTNTIRASSRVSGRVKPPAPRTTSSCCSNARRFVRDVESAVQVSTRC